MATSLETFGKYQIVERLSSGGMAEIFKARIEGIGGFHRYFAIKRILPELSSNNEFVDLLVDEAKVAGLLSHANIVQILDLGRIDEHYYIAMEYVNGPDLGQVLRRCRDKSITLPLPHAVFICIEMLKGLEYAHNRQVMRGGRPIPLDIVHRDISPPNILISHQGEIKLTDFGMARASVKALETHAGVVKGRFDYLSPEQSEGRPVDRRSDIFSAGVVLYEMLVGRHPFKKDRDTATLDAIRNGDYSPASEVNFEIPYSLDIILEKALAPDPGNRYEDATSFKEELDAFFLDSGFIFNQSTLAAFLEGLFPDRRKKKGRRQVEDPTRPRRMDRGEPDLQDFDDAPDEDEFEELRPTVVEQAPGEHISPFEPRSSDDQRGEGAAADGRGSAGALSDAATLLRRIPESQGGRQPEPPGFSEAQTLIRSNPLLDAAVGDVETELRRRSRALEDLEQLDAGRPTIPSEGGRPTVPGEQGPPPAIEPEPAPHHTPPPPKGPSPAPSGDRPARPEPPRPPPPVDSRGAREDLPEPPRIPPQRGTPPAEPPPAPRHPRTPPPPRHRPPPSPPAPVGPQRRSAEPERRPPSRSEARPSASPSRTTASRRPERSSFRSQLPYIVTSVFTLLLGFLGGYIAGMRFSGGAGVLPVEPEQVTVKREPVLELVVPQGAKVFVDDREHPGESPLSVQLTPGERHEVRVETPGQEPVAFPVKLDYNERRFCTVEWRTAD